MGKNPANSSQKRSEKLGKGQTSKERDGLTVEQRRERDKKAMEEKLAKKAEQKAGK